MLPGFPHHRRTPVFTKPLPLKPPVPVRPYAGLLLFVAAAAMIWWALAGTEHRAGWLRVEAPHHALVGQPFPVRVHLAPLAEPGILCADLHWGETRDTPMHYLSSGGSKAVGKEGGTSDFDIPVPSREGIRFVMGVIYFGPTENWSDHKLAANTELIPVVSNLATLKQTHLEPLRIKPSSDASSSHPPPAYAPRFLTGLLLLVAMMLAWAAGPSAKAADGRSGPETRWWQMLVVLLALASLWELSGLEGWLGNRARAIARAEDFYYPRAVLQKVVISVAVAATVLLLPFVRRVRSSRRLVLVSFALYLAISAANLVSLHAIDKVADLSWHGASLVQALKLGCAAMTLLGVRRMRRVGSEERL
jgi:hypothetical protein